MVVADPGARPPSASVAKANCGNSPPGGSAGDKKPQDAPAPPAHPAAYSGCWVGGLHRMVVSRRCFAGSWSRRWSRVSEAVDAAPVQQRPPLGPAQSQPHGMVSGEQADHQCRNPPPALAVQATPALDAAAPDPCKRCGCAGGSGFARWVWS